MNDVVETPSGKVRGVRLDSGVQRFAGVPYGSSTSGSGRFAPARPAEPWAGIVEAHEFGRPAPQPPLSDGETSERCLFLNLWTPSTSGRRPVVVWVHGGGYTTGHGNDAWADGEALASRHDLVVVSLNHRLGLLGFLDLESVAGDQFAGSGNAGLTDIVAALEWVRETVSAFGGDPQRVTVFGHSGGGGKVASLLAMPSTAGLIHRAGVHGGPPFGLRTREQAADTAGRVLNELGLRSATASRIRDVPVPRLMEVQRSLGATGVPGAKGMCFSPVIGTREIPVDPFTAFAAGVAADVPLILGSAVDEAGFAVLAKPAYLDPSWDLGREELIERVAPGLSDPSQATLLVDRYDAVRPGRRQRELFFEIMSDQIRVRTVRLAAARVAGGAADTYMYSIDVGHGVFPGAAHGVEMPFFFATLDRQPWTAVTPERRKLESSVSAAMAAFAHSGTPKDAQAWPRFDLGSRPQVLLSDSGRVERVDGFASDTYTAWRGIPASCFTDPWSRLL